jgi:hypothetical protein
MLVNHCRAHEAAIAAVMKTGDKKTIKYLAIHPATRANQIAAEKKS